MLILNILLQTIAFVIGWALMMAITYLLSRVLNVKWGEKESEVIATCIWPIGLITILLFALFKALHAIFINIKFFIDHYVFKDHIEKEEENDSDK